MDLEAVYHTPSTPTNFIDNPPESRIHLTCWFIKVLGEHSSCYNANGVLHTRQL